MKKLGSLERLLDGLPVSVPVFSERFGFDIGIALKGIACRSEGDPFRFSNVKDLPGNTLWILDISQTDFYIKVSQSKGFAHRKFFGDSIAVLAERYFLDFSTEDACLESAKGMAQAFARIVLAADNLIGLTASHYSRVPPTLAQWIQQSIIDFEGYESSQMVGDLFLRDIIKTVVNMPAISAPNQNSEATPNSYFLGRSRPDALDAISEIRVPCGAWSDLPLGDDTSSVQSKIEQILALGRPVLSQVVIHSPSEVLSRITREGLRSGSRRWVTEIDLVMLSQMAVLSILQARVCDRYVFLGSTLAKPCRSLLSLERSSVSYQIAAGALIRALAGPASSDGAYFATSRMAWVAATLRSSVLDCYLDSDFPMVGDIESYDSSGVIWTPFDPDKKTLISTIFPASGFDIKKMAPDKDIHVAQ